MNRIALYHSGAAGNDITPKLTIPIIGIGAGPHCDGQVLVTSDLLGISEKQRPFAKAYVKLRETITQAMKDYFLEVRQGKFPDLWFDITSPDLIQPKAGTRYKGNTAIGSRQFRLFKDVTIAVAGREGRYDCVELPAGEEPLLGLIPLEDLGLEPDLRNQRLIVLPMEGMQSYIRV